MIRGYLIQYQIELTKQWCEDRFVLSLKEVSKRRAELRKDYPNLKIRVLIYERTGEVLQ